METKVCNRCQIEKEITEFRNGRGDCKTCCSDMAREYRQINRDWVGIYKMEKGCEICGFRAEHHCQLDLHHVDPSTKTYKGSHKSYDAGWSKVRIEEELEKCMVVCKNCHALEGHNEGHWRNPTSDISMR